jgi:predicted NUDIX family NTP pyrophosphohydrolase
MPKRSAGLLIYRPRDQNMEVFLVHPGGPFWAKKGPGSVVDSQGRIPRGREPARSRSP